MTVVTKHFNQVNADVTLSDTATQHIVSYLAKQEVNRGIRLSVKKTGCSGLSYVIDYVQLPQDDDISQHLIDDYWIYIDKKSYPYLKGISVDYVKQGLNQKLVFTNPNQTGQCGCGESFTVDEGS